MVIALGTMLLKIDKAATALFIGVYFGLLFAHTGLDFSEILVENQEHFGGNCLKFCSFLLGANDHCLNLLTSITVLNYS